MALRIAGSSTDRINAGSGANIDNLDVGTALAWVYVVSASVGFFFDKSTGTTNRMVADFSGTFLRFRRDRATADTVISGDDGNFAAFGYGKWVLVAFVWDAVGTTDANQKIYVGDLTTPAAEPSAYGSQTAGSGGAVSNATADLIIGNDRTFANPLGGTGGADIAHIAFFNTRLTLEQVIEWQFNPANKPNCVLLHEYWGTGTQGDQSGNGNDGTVTGATATSHPGFARKRGGGYQGNVTVASGGITGDGAGTLAFSGSGAGTVAIAGAGAGTLVFSGAGAGTVAIAGAGAGTIVFSGAGDATVAVQGAGAGVLAVSGSGAGSVVVAGAGAGTILLNATGTGTVAIAGAGAGVIVFAGAGAVAGVAAPTSRRTVAALQPSRLVASLAVSRTIVVEVT